MTRPSPFAVVAGLDPGASNVGTCVWINTPAGPMVLEGVTVEIHGTGPAAVVDLSLRAVATVRQVLADHQHIITATAADAGVAVPAPLFCVENLIPPRRDTQQQRAVAQSNKVQTAVLATALSLGAVLAALDGELVEIVQPAGWDKRDGGPAVLRGRQPQGWRGRRGSERQHQRSAFFLSEEGLQAWMKAGNTPAPATGPAVQTAGAPAATTTATSLATASAAPPPLCKPAPAETPPRLAFCCIDAQYGRGCTHQPAAGGTPAKAAPAAESTAPPVVTSAPCAPLQSWSAPPRPAAAPAGYIEELVALVRQARAGTVAALAVAAQDALSLVPAPDGETEPSPADLAYLAVREHGVAPLLRLLPGLHDQLATITTRGTRLAAAGSPTWERAAHVPASG